MAMEFQVSNVSAVMQCIIKTWIDRIGVYYITDPENPLKSLSSTFVIHSHDISGKICLYFSTNFQFLGNYVTAVDDTVVYMTGYYAMRLSLSSRENEKKKRQARNCRDMAVNFTVKISWKDPIIIPKNSEKILYQCVWRISGAITIESPSLCPILSQETSSLSAASPDLS